MLRALLSGMSGLRSHQLRMDVIGDNVANANTVGFKASRVTFENGFAQLLAAATAGNGDMGGTDPRQVGSGVRVGAVDARFTQGSLEATGRPLDLAIQGNAFFVLGDGGKTVYSRAGNFSLDASGRLVLGGTGYVAQGMAADASGNATGPVGDLVLPLDQPSPPRKTTQVTVTGNLDASAEAGASHAMNVTVYDGAGRPYDLTLTFTAQGDGSWTWDAKGDEESGVDVAGGSVTFDADGKMTDLTYPDGAKGLHLSPPNGGDVTFELVAGGSGGQGFTSLAGTSTAAVTGQDGRQAGALSGLSIGNDGTIQGTYDNGETRTLGRIALATFANPAGLTRDGGNVFGASAASGEAIVAAAGDVPGSAVISGALEGSNVDISEEFTDMIVTQRGFQASARVVTIADQLLGELINLQR
jgi:flagellar hook protein FlgE